MKFKGLMKCYLKGIYGLLLYHTWCPHIYEEQNVKQGIVIASDNSFRVSDNYVHDQYETVYPDAGIITYKCTCCGHESQSWFRDWGDRYKYTEIH